MNIRKASHTDISGIHRLLLQVLMIHHNGRPDLFRPHAAKYTENELAGIIQDDTRPIFVAVDDAGQICGYAFCVLEQHVDSHILTDIKTLYLDDLCVEEEKRGRHVGSRLYEHVVAFAKEQGCYNLTLNVWSCNPAALRFYEKCGLLPQKIGMEKIL